MKHSSPEKRTQNGVAVPQSLLPRLKQFIIRVIITTVNKLVEE
jgi:hypothetical protein